MLSFAVLGIRGESHRHRILAVVVGRIHVGKTEEDSNGHVAVYEISMDQMGNRAAVRGDALFRPFPTPFYSVGIFKQSIGTRKEPSRNRVVVPARQAT